MTRLGIEPSLRKKEIGVTRLGIEPSLPVLVPRAQATAPLGRHVTLLLN